MLLSRVGFVIFGYVIDTQAMFSVAVFIVGIVATEWASIASTLGIDGYRSALSNNSDPGANDLISNLGANALGIDGYRSASASNAEE